MGRSIRKALGLLKFARENPKSTQSTLNASAAVPSSGFTFIDNSQGASAAVAELSDALIDAFEDFDLQNSKTELESLIKSLDEKGSEFSNSKLKDEQCQPWFCSEEEARLIAIAWKCADESYNETFVGVEEESPYYVESLFPKTPSDGLLPMLVIAIRGSASQVDFMVNANGNPRDVKGFIPTSRFHDINPNPSLQAHAGFLGCASALDSIVSKQIEKYKETKGVTHVLFTGHSAGGAVASLLYLRNLFKCTDDSPSFKFSCITFGAPPTVTFPVNLHQSSSSHGLCLNIINEFDPVARADKAYILSVTGLFEQTVRFHPNLN
ncbi:hypothetical protein N7493_008515 [Penicillium malachiteum]|uniref:Fungal lipase-type domain-containing protein n=1 Tax=Penicillium malachiteum TaxID=1324776 RepID=A0AAD6MTS4_9EURO|nr:hypothetical protein N7493_008515 [Penicillium malachiteum]